MNKCFITFLFSILTFSQISASEKYNNFLFGVDYYPEQWPESYWEQDAKLMRDCGINTIRIGEFAWYYMEPEEGTYQFETFDRVIELFGKYGIKTILGTPTATPPKWLTHKYPEVLNAYSNGQTMNDQSRRYYSYNSPVYIRLSKSIVEAMAKHYKDNPDIIGWQIDNEFNCEVKNFYSENDRVAFREWLRKKYVDLDTLNVRWGNQVWSQWYSDWDQIDLPFPTPASHNPALMLDYKRFISDSAISFSKNQSNIIRKYRPDDFITHNGLFNLDYHKLCKDLDIYALDCYPTFQETPQYPIGSLLTITRGFMNNFMLMEQQSGPGGSTDVHRTPRPGEMSLWAFQAVAHGADGILHFRWRTARKGAEEYWSGVIGQDNIPRARYDEFKKEGQEINKINKEIFGSKIISDIAVIRDCEVLWVFEHQYLSKELDISKEYSDLFQAASMLKYNIDIIDPRNDFSHYKIIFAPHQLLMNKEFADKITGFVDNGGIFILSAHSAIKDYDNGFTDMIIPIFLTKLFGVERVDFNCYSVPSKNKNSLKFSEGSKIPIHVFADCLKTIDAKTIAVWDRDFIKDIPACTEKKTGKGKAVYYGSFFNLESAQYLIKRYAAENGIKPIMENIPDIIEVTRRTKDNINYYFMLNHSAENVPVTAGNGYYDLLKGQPFPVKYVLKPFEYKILKK